MEWEEEEDKEEKVEDENKESMRDLNLNGICHELMCAAMTATKWGD